MPRAGFYNDNEYRAYPFVFKTEYSSAIKLPADVIVDCGFIMGLDSAYAADIHAVYLHSVTRIDNTFEFTFKTSAPAAANLPIIFTQEITDDEWQANFAESAAATAANFCAEEPAWEGFIIVGRLGALQELLPSSGTIVFYAPESITATDTPDYAVEPARMQSLVRAYVRSINVANYARPIISGCGSSSSSSNNEEEPEREIIINGQCMKGAIKLKAGFNCGITQDNNTNTLIISAYRREIGANEFDTEICQYGSELPLYEGHEPPPGSLFLSGGPACDDLITSINGIGGANITIGAEAGVQIVSDAENSIKIDITSNIVQKDCG